MSVTFIDLINNNNNNGAVRSQKSGSVLFFVSNSSAAEGAVSIRYGKDGGGALHSFILAGGAPVFKWRSAGGESSYGPGCGRDNAGCAKMPAALKNIVPPGGPDIKTAFKNAQEFLGCLDTGFYLLSFVDHYPVGITGDFFGGWPGEREFIGYKLNYAKSQACAFPAYLAPSAASHEFDAARIEYYRNELKNGRELYTVALYFDDFISLLLKGHHRAAAAYLEGRAVPCLTVIPCSGYAHDGNIVTTLFFASDQIDASLVHKEFLFEIMRNKDNKLLNEDETRRYADMRPEGRGAKSSILPADTAAARYADLKITEGLSILRDISDEKIASLLSAASPDYRSVEIMLDVLIGLKDPRAYNFALKLAGSETYMGLWHAAFSHLAGFKNKEVEDLFVNYLINDECGLSDITAIVDEYLESENR